MVEGILRINPKNYEDGYICAADNGQDILIQGVRNRCRALNGDVVVVKPEPAWLWVVNHQAVQDFLDKQGTEEDRQILMSDCRVNIKEEKLEQKMVEKSRGEVKSNRSEDPAVVVQLDVSLDSYLPPGPRQPDTLVMASRRCESEELKPGPAALGGEWGAGQVSQTKWEVEEVEDKLGAMMLQEVMGQEAARGRQVVGAKGVLREEEGLVMAARVQEVALEVGQAGRVPVEREVQRIESDSIKLVTILGWDSGPCSSDSQSW